MANTPLDKLLTGKELGKIQTAADNLKKKIVEINKEYAKGVKPLEKTLSNFDKIGAAIEEANKKGKVGSDTAKDQTKFLSKKMKEMGSGVLKEVDGLLGGMGSKIGDSATGMKGMGKAGAGVLVVLAAAFEILKQFSAKVDLIGASFGVMGTESSEFQQNLLDSEESAIKVGKSLEDVLTTVQTLSGDYGITLDTASLLSAAVIDTSVALGVSTDTSTKLVGNMISLAGLSERQAINFGKMVYQLAKANEVSPQAVLRDLSASSADIAGFTKEMGDNIGIAAVKSRSFGIEFSTIAQSARGVLDYQSAIEKGLTASTMIGRQVNVFRLQQLAIAGDLNKFQDEQVRLLGTESEFLSMDILQREALAAAVGLSLDQAAKMITKQKESITLAGELGRQPGFDELLGERGISELTALIGELKAVSADFVNTFGPILTGLVWVVRKTVQVVNVALEMLGINALMRVAQGQTADFGKNMAASFDALMGTGGTGGGIIGTAGVSLQDGGVAMGPTRAVVGDAGPEFIAPIEPFYAMMEGLFHKQNFILESISENVAGQRAENTEYLGPGGSAAKEIGKGIERVKQNTIFG